MKRLFIHIQYWITFIIIPFIVILRELIRLYSESYFWFDIKRQMKAQYQNYEKFRKQILTH